MDKLGRCNILIVEDNEPEAMLTKQLLENSKLNVKVEIINDGDKAIEFIKKEGEFSEAFDPDLILLDINLPGKNGHQILQEIRKEEQLVATPVIMLSSSTSSADIENSYKLGANSYMPKPMNLSELRENIVLIEKFWLHAAKIPLKTSNL
ncbi:MAG: response regulator [bacterium]